MIVGVTLVEMAPLLVFLNIIHSLAALLVAVLCSIVKKYSSYFLRQNLFIHRLCRFLTTAPLLARYFRLTDHSQSVYKVYTTSKLYIMRTYGWLTA